VRPDPSTAWSDPSHPWVSLVVYNYEGTHLRRCLDGIFNQTVITDFEVVAIDDATHDGAWPVLQEFVRRFPPRITVQRNRIPLGPNANLSHGICMARGRYLVMLTGDQAFDAAGIRRCIEVMMAEPDAAFRTILRAEDPNLPVIRHSPRPLPNMSGTPLVSILCYNYNYGRYLRQCLESVFCQSYPEIELCFSDNASTDDSWGIALEFAGRYPDRMTIVRNRLNFGPDVNFGNCRRNLRGKYYVNFCSDDVMAPDYVARCVAALEERPEVGMALVHRAILDESGRRTDEPPFYNRSCIIPGQQQAAVYMMAGVNPSVSQIMYRQAVVDARTATGGLANRYYGTRILDFNISMDFGVAYIKEPLLLHRIHSQSDTSQADANLLPIMGLYVLNHQFADLASVRNAAYVISRLPESLQKIARLALRYSVRSLLTADEKGGQRYAHLAAAIDPHIMSDPTWVAIQEYWAADEDRKHAILQAFKNSENLAARSISYDPPAGSEPLSTHNRQQTAAAV
jgi:glycosyltransferase involved in cell wall biosynthesis